MRNPIGFPEFDNSDTQPHDTVIYNVRRAMQRLIGDTYGTDTCPTCAYAALVHCATAMLRLAGVEPEEISDIVANAISYADKTTAEEAREAFEGDESASQEATNG